MNNVASNILRIIIVLLLQVFICNLIHLFGFITPAIYILGLLLLPLELPKSVQYLIGFCCGLFVDMFTHTLGFNTAACTIIMFIRPYIVKALNGRKTSDSVERPIPGVKDFKWLISYVGVLTLVHQSLIVMLETMKFHNFLYTFIAIIGNTVLTTFLILCTEYIFYPVQGKNK
ncbi:MAG: rod shape-determining protein MreD [Bacteroidales bacterium]|nr:rod shape-determining protein MreD [Bacteroidales bacterium]